MTLTEKRCVPCEEGTEKFHEEKIQEYVREIDPQWQVLKKPNDKLYRDFKFKDFKGALDFANRIGALAESEGHHPDLLVSWGKVGVELSTHAIHGLSENDFILASKIDKL